jgi:hypothetical protein
MGPGAGGREAPAQAGAARTRKSLGAKSSRGVRGAGWRGASARDGSPAGAGLRGAAAGVGRKELLGQD